MTNISKEAVEHTVKELREIADAQSSYAHDDWDDSDCLYKTLEQLTALSARVEELEKVETAARRLWMCDANGNRSEVYGACERAKCKVYKFDAVLLQLGANREALKGETTND